MRSSGFVLLDKPSGVASRLAGRCIARMFGAKTFGHVGTLDPMASGLIVIALGEATKMIPYLKAGAKEYEFSIQWGKKTDTDDITGRILEENNLAPSSEQIAAVLPDLIGEIWQTPPAYSAVHIKGRRAYELARRGEAIEMPERKVTVYDLKFDIENSTFSIRCSTGTYIRSIARDMADLLNLRYSVPNLKFLASAKAIRRTETNGFDIKCSVRLDFLENLFNNSGRGAVESYLRPLDFGLGDIPVLNLNDMDAEKFRHGNFSELTGANAALKGLLRVYSGDEFIGIGEFDGTLLKPRRVINK
jgi:tRNA pseudouridine55 synthase